MTETELKAIENDHEPMGRAGRDIRALVAEVRRQRAFARLLYSALDMATDEINVYGRRMPQHIRGRIQAALSAGDAEFDDGNGGRASVPAPPIG